MGLFDTPFSGPGTTIFDPPVGNAGGQPVYDQDLINAMIMRELGLGGGGGGGGGYDPYAVNPLDQAMFDWQKEYQGGQLKLGQDEFEYGKSQDSIANARNDAILKMQQSQQEADMALALGDFNLAKQKQDDANYWAGINAGFEQQSLNLQNQGQQLDYAASMASIQQRAAQAENDYAVGMANASNEAERTMVQDKWNQQQALIAQMQDATDRLLGQQSNQTNQFGAETDRQTRLGQIALDQNKFIAEMARSPRDLFSLYFMQRGQAPDWDTMVNGGAPAQGQALAPRDPFSVYTPTTAAPTFNAPLKQDLQIVSGNVAQGAGGNQFIQSKSPSSSAAAGGGVAAPAPQFLSYMDPKAVAAPPKTQDTNVYLDANPGGRQGGVPMAAMKPGLNMSTVGGTNSITGADFDLPAYYDQGKTRAIGKEDVITPGMKVWVDYQPTPRAAMGTPGYTTAKQLMVGDAKAPSPWEGGARPELIKNPTGAPIAVVDSDRTRTLTTDWSPAPLAKQSPSVGTAGPYLPQAPRPVNLPPPAFRPGSPVAAAARPYGQGTTIAQLADYFPPRSGQLVRPRQVQQKPMMSQQDLQDRYMALMGRPSPVARFAFGTDASGQYAAAGMGSAWLPSSSNAQLDGMDIPPRLKMLADAGAPISPSLAAAATGQLAPTLDFGNVFANRGLGGMTSLQALGRQTKGETENYRGYVEGVGGVPWADYIDSLSKMTAHLKGAQTARAA